MSQPPPAPANPPPPRKTRPSAWWFALGGALLVGAAAAFVGILFFVISDFTEVDATVPADGAAHEVAWTGSQERMIWVRARDSSNCAIIEPTDGGEVVRTDVSGSFTRSVGSQTWVGIQNFPAGSGSVLVTCSSAFGPIQIGPAPNVGGFVGGIFAAILVPLALGLLGLTVLVVTGVLFATRDPRPGRAARRPRGGPAR